MESALGAPVAPATSWQLPAPPPRPPRARARPAPPAPRAPAAPKSPEELAASATEVLAPDAAAVARELRAAREKAARERPFWVLLSFRATAGDFRARREWLAEWWRHWRTTAAFRVLVAFVAIYGLMAVMRAPSDVVVERSRRNEDRIFLQTFLKKYAAAGGPVFGVRPHGGSELFPRGVLLQGEMLAAFARATAGETFVVKTSGAQWNPLQGFYGYPPVFAGGAYFPLERKFNFALYEFTFLMRKDSERAGAVLLARVDIAR